MRTISSFLFSAIYLISSSSFAQNDQARFATNFDPSFTAKQSAGFLNEMGNLENLTKFLEVSVGKPQANAVRKILEARFNMHTPFPKFSVRGNKVISNEGQIITINKDRTFNINGLVFHPPEQALDLFLEDLVQRLKPVAQSSFLIPAAEAFSTETNLTALSGAGIVVGLAVLVASPFIGAGMATLGTVTFVLGVAGLVIVIGNKYYQMGHSGEVQCRGSRYVVRFKPQGELSAEYHEMPNSAILYPKDKDGKTLECTSERAAQLQQLLQGSGSHYVDSLEPGAVR